MKVILKLLVTLIVVNAAVRAASVTWNYYQFRDGAQQALVFGAQKAPGDVANQIFQRAVELNLPVDPDNVTVQRIGTKTVANAHYVDKVELFPTYEYPVSFDFTLDAVSLAGLK